MKFLPLLLASFATVGVSAAHSSDLVANKPASIAGMFRALKSDGSTVLAQGLLAPGFIQQIGLKGSDAIADANGRCAFNVKIDEVSQVAISGSTTRLYSNDTLVANVSKLDLPAKASKSLLTQPYLFAGQNNVKVVFNADSIAPTISWVRVFVDGACTAKPLTPAPAPVKAGSADWNSLFTAYGYSNYAVNGLKTKNYARYSELVAVNAALVAAVKAGTIERSACASLMARWNAIANDTEFKAAMGKVVPGGDHHA